MTVSGNRLKNGKNPSIATVPEVYIVESLPPEDVRSNLREGIVIKRMLQLGGRFPRYKYVEDIGGLSDALRSFGKSHYRYLHISCHGGARELELAREGITIQDFGAIATPHLGGKRLFLSTCLATNSLMASTVLKDSDCRSIAGPDGEVGFDDAAIMWPPSTT